MKCSLVLTIFIQILWVARTLFILWIVLAISHVVPLLPKSSHSKDNSDIDTTELFNALSTLSYRHRSSEYVVHFREYQDSFGGFGNLILGAIGIVTLATCTGRVAEINHCMLAEMYSHPDRRLHFANTMDRGDGTRTLLELPLVGNRNPQQLAALNKNAYLERKNAYVNIYTTAADTLAHASFFLPYLPGMSPSDPRLYDVISSTVAEWMFSAPTPALQAAYVPYLNHIRAQCGRGTAVSGGVDVELAVQLRTWQDVPERRDYFETHRQCTYDCLLQRVLHARQQVYQTMSSGDRTRLRGLFQANGGSRPAATTNMCVFVTTDNATVTKEVTRELTRMLRVVQADTAREVSEHIAKFDSSTPGLDDIILMNAIDITFVHSLEMVAASAQWHSVNTIRKGRVKFDPADLSRHVELLDWIMMGDAAEAVYSRGSSYGRTARMRGGYHKQRHDFIVGSFAQDGSECTCQPVRPENPADVVFSELGVIV